MEERALRKSQNEKPVVQIAEPTPAATIDNTAPKKKLSFKEKFEFEQLEKEMASLEEEKAKLSAQLEAGSNNHEDLTKWADRISVILKELDDKAYRWMELSELIN
jgi:ATP-binding cassette subfamily F protein uup